MFRRPCHSHGAEYLNNSPELLGWAVLRHQLERPMNTHLPGQRETCVPKESTCGSQGALAKLVDQSCLSLTLTLSHQVLRQAGLRARTPGRGCPVAETHPQAPERWAALGGFSERVHRWLSGIRPYSGGGANDCHPQAIPVGAGKAACCSYAPLLLP